MEFIPPLVTGNRLEQYNDVRDTLGETGMDIGGYIRISTKKDSQKTSIDNQKKYIEEWARVNGYNVVDYYIDVKTGAYSYLRNEMTRLKNHISAGKIKGIVSKEISRTSRDIMDIIELKRSLVNQGAFFISIKEGYDSRTDDDEFLLVIHAGLAQKERKVTGSRVKITQMIKAKEGKTNVPRPALGYMLSKDGQHLVVNPETVEIYHLIVSKFMEGWGRLKICKFLNSRGIKTGRGNTNWSTNAIYSILTNPVYLGVTMYNVTLTVRDSDGKAKRMVRPREQWVIRENTHPALITKEKFERIYQIIQERKEKDNKEWSNTKKYLLSGILYCGSCGGKLYGGKILKNRAQKKNKPERIPDDYYHYYFDKKNSGNCKNKVTNYKMSLVDQKVIDTIKNFITDEVLEKSLANKQYVFNTTMEKDKREREILIDRINAVKSAFKKQYVAYEEGVITLEEYKTRLNELRHQNDQLEAKLSKVNSKLEKSNNGTKAYFEIKERVKSLIDNLDKLDMELKEEIIRKLIKKIYIHDDYTLNYEFNFEV
jgi:site-specific DNA recombinase